MAVLSLFKLSSNMVWLFDQHFLSETLVFVLLVY